MTPLNVKRAASTEVTWCSMSSQPQRGLRSGATGKHDPVFPKLWAHLHDIRGQGRVSEPNKLWKSPTLRLFDTLIIPVELRFAEG